MILINKTNILIFCFIFIIIFPGVSVAGDNGDHHEHSEHLVLKLHGTGFMYSMEVPGMEEGDEPMDAMCFELDVIDLKSNEIIGSGTDCMSNVEMKENGNVALVGTTYFYLPEGQLIARGAITVQPVPVILQGLPTPMTIIQLLAGRVCLKTAQVECDCPAWLT